MRSHQWHFVYSEPICRGAIDRGIRLAECRSFPADLACGHETRDAIHEEIVPRGWSAERRAFVPHYSSQALYVAILTMQITFRFLSADPRMLGFVNHLVLYAGETGPRGAALGNFLQAITHLALTSPEMNLDRGARNWCAKVTAAIQMEECGKRQRQSKTRSSDLRLRHRRALKLNGP